MVINYVCVCVCVCVCVYIVETLVYVKYMCGLIVFETDWLAGLIIDQRFKIRMAYMHELQQLQG